MIMLGLSNAASVRIVNELEDAYPQVAKFAVLVMVTTNLILSLIIRNMVGIDHWSLCSNDLSHCFNRQDKLKQRSCQTAAHP
ncbi:hypothetical protein ZIOFF_021886 [Zingiber officinale]|uniref:Uncharacterized protein n=1 Tax=Zingiber officinale TaxID=94328 RepID=A0A8J5H0S6_ZINOF|nr:hypothetical protein ZIOFF_021886 [Zingiber officinale]